MVPADHVRVPAPGTGLGGLGFLDILFNMWALVVVGPSLEQLLGRVRFLAVYLLSAIGGAVAFYYIGSPTAWRSGASGAVFGLFGAWFVVARKLRLDVRGIVTIIAINLAFSLFYRSTIAWQDHVGGLIVGALTTAAFAYAPRKNRTAIQVAAAVAILAVLVVLVIFRNHELTASPSSAPSATWWRAPRRRRSARSRRPGSSRRACAARACSPAVT